MRRTATTRSKAILAVAICAAGLTAVSPSASAATVPIELCAIDGAATLVGSVSVPIWGFANPTSPGNCSGATATLPGPQLVVNEGDSVSVKVINALPPGHTLTFEAPGINFDPGGTDAAVGASVTMTFTATNPGTYLYTSAGDAGRQQAMGLAGLLIVRSATAGQAYDDATTAYDREAPLVLGAVDPAFNNDPDNFNLHDYHATYWLINGKSYPDVPAIGGSGPRVLLRYVNAGYDNTTMMLLGTHERVVARSAHLLNNPFGASAETIPAGATEDTIVTVPSSAPPSTNGFPLFNRQLHLTNGEQTGVNPSPLTGGGMLTFIQP